MIKSQFKENILNFHQLALVATAFIWHEDSAPRGYLFLPRGYVHVRNREKKKIQITVQ